MGRDVTSTAPGSSTVQLLLSQWLHWSLRALLILFHFLIRSGPYTFLHDWSHKLVVIWTHPLLQGCLGGFSVCYTLVQCWWELPERDVNPKSSLQQPGVNSQGTAREQPSSLALFWEWHTGGKKEGRDHRFRILLDHYNLNVKKKKQSTTKKSKCIKIKKKSTETTKPNMFTDMCLKCFPSTEPKLNLILRTFFFLLNWNLQ